LRPPTRRASVFGDGLHPGSRGHCVIADLKGKAGHIRTVPVPQWVKAAVDAWSTAAGITAGTVFRSINKSGMPKVLWEVVKEAASRAGIEKLAPHDLRRTCARLCHLASGELDQIQFFAGTRLDPNDRAIPRMPTMEDSAMMGKTWTPLRFRSR